MATGAQRSIHWGHEITSGDADNFGLGAQVVNKPFGFAVEAEPELERNMQYRYGMGARNFQAARAGRIAGRINPAFDLADPWIFEEILGAHGAITGSAGSYATTFSERDVPLSMEVDICQQMAAGVYALRKLYGVTCKRATLGIEAGSDTPLRVSMECDYAKEALSAPGSFTAQALPQQAAPLIFANAMLLTSSNDVDYTVISNIDRIDLTIDQGAELRYALGSGTAVRKRFGQRSYGISIANLFDDVSEFLTKLYGQAGSPLASGPTPINYMRLVLTAEVGGTIQFDLSKVYPNNHAARGNEPNDELTEAVELTAQSLSISISGWDNTEPTRK